MTVSIRRLILLSVLASAALVVGTKSCQPRNDGQRGPLGMTWPRAIKARSRVQEVVPWFGQQGAGVRRIAGRVTYASRPVASATVQLTSEATAAGAADVLSLTTEGDGRFDFGDLPLAEYTVTAVATGKTAAGIHVDLRNPTSIPNPTHIELALGDCKHLISGYIKDSGGGAIAGATIALEFADADTAIVADREGRYHACVVPGVVRLWVSANGYARGGSSVYAYRHTRQDVQLSPEATLSGRAVSSEDGRRLPGVLVQIRPVDYTEAVMSATTTTDSQGNFEATGLAPGRYQLTARAAGRATRRPTEVVATVGGEATDAVLQLGPTFPVRGRVVEDDRPVAGAYVHASGLSLESFDVSGVSQADGSLVLDGLQLGETQVAVRGYEVLQPDRFTVTPSMNAITFHVRRAAAVRGRVVRLGKPIPRSRVFSAYPSGDPRTSTYSRADGTFELAGLEPGIHEIGCESEEQGAFGSPVAITLAKGQVQDGFVCDLALASTISGVVVDEKEAPVSGVVVEFSLLGGRDFGFGTTADDGTFTARSLSGGGDYEVQVRPAFDSTLLYRPAHGNRFQLVSVANGESEVSGVRIAIRHERLSIVGRLVRANGEPVPDANVSALLPQLSTRPGLDANIVATATTALDGSFALHDLVRGTYSVRARTGTGIAVELEAVTAGRTDLRLELPQGGAIVGKLLGFGEVPDVVVFPGNGQRFRAQVDNGAFYVRDLPASNYVLTATTNAEGDTATVVLKAGATAKVTLRSNGTATVLGTAIDFRTRERISGAECYWHHWSNDARESYFGATGEQHVWSNIEGLFAMKIPARKSIQIHCIPRDWANESVNTASIQLNPGASTNVEMLFVNRHIERTERGYVGIDPGPRAPTTIEHLDPMGPAARAGLQKGDAIAAVDGVSVEQLDPGCVHLLVIDHPIGESAVLTIRRSGASETRRLVIGPPGKERQSSW